MANTKFEIIAVEELLITRHSRKDYIIFTSILINDPSIQIQNARKILNILEYACLVFGQKAACVLVAAF